jgi:hypothetical protein
LKVAAGRSFSSAPASSPQFIQSLIPWPLPLQPYSPLDLLL